MSKAAQKEEYDLPKVHAAPTRHDVAVLANVSETIVSYVINKNRYVAAEKRKRVLEAVERLHYRPNSNARALRGKGSGHILFIVDSIENEYFGRMARAMDAIAYEKGYLITLLAVRNDDNFVARILARQADAAIISSSVLRESYIQELINAGLPVLLLMSHDYAGVTGPVSRIDTGLESGTHAAMNHLYRTGCRHFVQIDRVGADRRISGPHDLRYRAFVAHMQALGLPIGPDNFLSGFADYNELMRAIRLRLQNGAPMDALVCRNDQLALAALSACQGCGVRVPEEISIIGFDNASVSSLLRPSLSSVEIDRPQIARAAIEILNGMVRGEAPQNRQFLTNLVLRDSTRSVNTAIASPAASVL